MVNFDQACKRAWGQNIQVKRQPLITNYRSHPDVINWCDNYIQSFDVMNEVGARVSNKLSIEHAPNWLANRQTKGIISGSYPSVAFMVGQGKSRGKPQRCKEAEQNVAEQFADLVQELKNNKIVHDFNQCVLLLKSVRDWSAGPYQRALEEKGIPVYNPRARTFLEQEEIQTALGALVTILDPSQRGLRQVRSGGIKRTIQNWVKEYKQIAQNHPDFSNYVSQAIDRIRQIPADKTITQVSSRGSTTIPATIQETFYHIISFEPFATWQRDPERTVRLGGLSKILESYSSVPFREYVGSTRGTLRTDSSTAGQVHTRQLNHFYYSLVGLLVSEGLNDPEEEEVICPPGRFPIMTVHQAKGLEFPFVFVAKIGVQEATVGAEHQLEDVFQSFRTNPLPVTFTANQRAEQDYIRLFYVAYSRAKYTLILLTTSDELRDEGLGFGDNGRRWFEQRVQRI